MHKQQLCSRFIIIPKFLSQFSVSSLLLLSPGLFAFCFVVFVRFRQINVGRNAIKSLIVSIHAYIR